MVPKKTLPRRYNSNTNYKQGNQREVRMVNHNNNKVDKIMKTLYNGSWIVRLSVSFPDYISTIFSLGWDELNTEGSKV